jgi:hypothetical protein
MFGRIGLYLNFSSLIDLYFEKNCQNYFLSLLIINIKEREINVLEEIHRNLLNFLMKVIFDKYI